MLRDLTLKPKYNSKNCDLGEDFYNKLLRESTKYYRVSAYFTARALSMYSQGLHDFSNRGGEYKLIINHQISQEDFNEMANGLEIKESVSQKIISSLSEKIASVEEMHLSNLAFFLAVGTLKIKIAFVANGIFHDKFGFFFDESDDFVYFRGSNNETEAAINSNYEAFDISLSWLQTNDFEREKLEINLNDFETLWNNEVEDVLVLDVDRVIKEKLLEFNKGKIIIKTYDLYKNCLFLTLNQNSNLICKLSIDNTNLLKENIVFMFDIMPYVEKIDQDTIYFYTHFGYLDFRKIIVLFESLKTNFSVIIDEKLIDFINSLDFKIEERRRIGINIKNKDTTVLPYFTIFEEIVNERMSRKLRQRQMWDAFFMYSMKRVCNFSVPGSGKTASVYGTYALLKEKSSFKRLIIVGPKNSLNTWKYEFKECFGYLPLVTDIQELSHLPRKQRLEYLLTMTGNSELILFNYDSLPNLVPNICSLVNKKTMLVFDEVHKIKKIDGITSNAAIELSKNAEYMIHLTGTPIPNSYKDIFNVLTMMFKDEYKYYVGINKEWLTAPNDNIMKQINDKLFPFFCRTTKDQLNVPKINDDSIIDLYASKYENEIYEHLINNYKDNRFALFIRILQLESNPKLLLEKISKDDFENIWEDIDDYAATSFQLEIENEAIKEKILNYDSSTKLNYVVNMIEKLMIEKKSVIIWCIFTQSINDLYESLSDKKILCNVINGQVSNEDRQKRLDSFKSGEVKVLITNPATLAESVSLHKNCHDAIYYEFSYNLVHLLQSKDRIHRLGLEENQYTQYYFLKTIFNRKGVEESIDLNVYNRLKLKEQIMLDAIDRNKLEVVPTSKQDLDEIFKFL